MVKSDPKTERMQLVLSLEELRLLDEYRRSQEDLPNRSEAVRRLIVATKKPKR